MPLDLLSSPQPRRWFTFKNKRHMPVWLAWLLARLLSLYAWTFRVRFDDPSGWLQSMSPWPVIVPIWHNRLLFIPSLAPKDLRQRAAVLISASRDGEYIATVTKFFQIQVVRGSSSRGGQEALRGLLQKLEEKITVAITVDGPRGPRYTVQPGIVALAAMAQIAILPIAVNAEKFWQLRSWDGTQIPKPFSKVTIKVGTPFHLPSDVDRREGMEKVRQELLAITDDQNKKFIPRKRKAT